NPMQVSEMITTAQKQLSLWEPEEEMMLKTIRSKQNHRDGEFTEIISLPKNDLLRSDSPVVKEHLILNASLLL
ncbi:hypothetical protein J0S82_004359, partial [Galemys pyrenaicus]